MINLELEKVNGMQEMSRQINKQVVFMLTKLKASILNNISREDKEKLSKSFGVFVAKEVEVYDSELSQSLSKVIYQYDKQYNLLDPFFESLK